MRRNEVTKYARVVQVLLAGVAVVGVVLKASGGITLLEPSPFWVLFLYPVAMALDGDVVFLAELSLSGCFFLWSIQLFTGAERIPRRSVILSVVTGAASTTFLLSRASFMAQRDLGYYLAMLGINAGIMVALAVLYKVGSRQPSFARSLLFHWVLFAWMGSYAFPWLFETI